MTFNKHHELANELLSAVQAAGRIEMEFYDQNVEVAFKTDNSPVTAADQAAETILLERLANIAPQIPVIAEEAASHGIIPDIGERFFLVDPLDGTKEFINKSHEFTVNIALIDKAEPVFGMVYAPATKDLYVTLAPDKVIATQLDPFGPKTTLSDLDMTRVTTSTSPENGLAVVASKSHMTKETKAFIAQYKVRNLQSAGSSLKFCLLARGDADLYPRFGPTMEWDTAVGDAVLRAAGGQVLTVDGKPLTYGKVDKNYLNPFFIAWADADIADRQLV